MRKKTTRTDTKTRAEKPTPSPPTYPRIQGAGTTRPSSPIGQKTTNQRQEAKKTPIPTRRIPSRSYTQTQTPEDKNGTAEQEQTHRRTDRPPDQQTGTPRHDTSRQKPQHPTETNQPKSQDPRRWDYAPPRTIGQKTTNHRQEPKKITQCQRIGSDPDPKPTETPPP